MKVVAIDDGVTTIIRIVVTRMIMMVAKITIQGSDNNYDSGCKDGHNGGRNNDDHGDESSDS